MIVNTSTGKVEGVQERNMIVFKGIPYAQPPINKLRFQAPVPAFPWLGVYKADQFGKRALQTHEQEYQDEIDFSEDCLHLNIWTPAIDERKRPVVFYIHGGGHFSGSNSDRWIDGMHLIGASDAVMVAPNYRLGGMGYLYLGEILGKEYEDSGNCGLLDQILALTWVRSNIAAFGGDPDRITLMGQSAGGKSVANLLVTPSVKGMFRGAIIQSGSVQCIRDKQTATQIAKMMIRQLGIVNTPEEILCKSGQEIMEAQKILYEVVDRAHMFGPVIDGKTITEKPEEYIEAGNITNIPIMIGYNRDELCYCKEGEERPEEESIAAFKKSYGLHWEVVYRKYCEYKKENTSAKAFDRTQTLCVYENAAISLTQLLSNAGNKVWSYRWDYGIRGGPSQHFSEMPYIFQYIEEVDNERYTEEEAAMAKRMNQTWLKFICEGNPQNERIPTWYPNTTSEMGYRMYFDRITHMEQFNLRSNYQEFPMQVIKL